MRKLFQKLTHKYRVVLLNEDTFEEEGNIRLTRLNLIALIGVILILLVAIIAAIALTMRRRPETRYLDPATQVLVKKKDRLRIIKMEAEE